jgi:hypothetical protein
MAQQVAPLPSCQRGSVGKGRENVCGMCVGKRLEVRVYRQGLTGCVQKAVCWQGLRTCVRSRQGLRAFVQA